MKNILVSAMLLLCSCSGASSPQHSILKTCWVGDVDGDGNDDLAIMAYDFDGRGFESAWVFSVGSGDLLATYPDIQMMFGGVGDVNGDGASDVAVRTGSGEVAILSGGDGEPLYRLDGETQGEGRVCCIGDVDYDGVGDYVVGFDGAGRHGKGRAIAYAGSSGKVLYEVPGEREWDYFGQWIANAEPGRFWVGANGRGGRYCYLVSAEDGDIVSRSAPSYMPSVGSIKYSVLPPRPCLRGQCVMSEVRYYDGDTEETLYMRECFGDPACDIEGLGLSDVSRVPSGDFDQDGLWDVIVTAIGELPHVELSGGGAAAMKLLLEDARYDVDAENDYDGDGWRDTVIVERALLSRSRISHGVVSVYSGVGGECVARWKRSPARAEAPVYLSP